MLDHAPSRVGDALFKAALWLTAALVVGACGLILLDLLWRGGPAINWSFLTEAPRNAGRSGGIAPILWSTLLILAVALATALPLGLACAVWLTEYLPAGSRRGRVVRVSLDALAGIPSIVFGLFGHAFFSVTLGLGFSILSGGLTLACMVLPIFIRTSEAGLSALGDDWRRQGAALGMTRASVLRHVLLPAAMPAITAGAMLGVGRACAETAALIFTSGYVDRWPDSLGDSGRALAVHIYDLSMNVTGGDAAAYGSALVLMALIALINAVTMGLSMQWVRHKDHRT